MQQNSVTLNKWPDMILDLDALRNHCNNNSAIIAELLDHLCKKSCPKWMAAIREGVRLENCNNIGEVCHAMKGVSATLYAWRIANLALALEKLAHDMAIGEISDRLTELQTAFDELDQWIKAQPDLSSLPLHNSEKQPE